MTDSREPLTQDNESRRKPWFDWNDPSVPVGNSPVFPRWPVAVLGTFWVAWVVFLVIMLISTRAASGVS